MLCSLQVLPSVDIDSVSNSSAPSSLPFLSSPEGAPFPLMRMCTQVRYRVLSPCFQERLTAEFNVNLCKAFHCNGNV